VALAGRFSAARSSADNFTGPRLTCIRSRHPLRGLLLHGSVHRPPGHDISDGQGEAVLARRIAALVADKIDPYESRHRVNRVNPVNPDTDRDLQLQRGAQLRGRALSSVATLSRISAIFLLEGNNALLHRAN
jgi:hypothetical protein